MLSDPQARDVIVITAAAVAALATVLALVALSQLRRLRRDYALLQATDEAPSFIAAVARKAEQVAGLRTQVSELSAGLEQTRAELADALRHVSVVRYDAFGDLGGRLSFTAALLDDGGDGLVLTSLHGRSESRSYLKGIKGGQAGEEHLSPEELQAISYALRGTPR